MTSQKDSKLIANPRTATISQNESGPIGVCIFLTAAELFEFNVDPGQAESIEYKLVRVDGETRLKIVDSAIACAKDSISD